MNDDLVLNHEEAYELFRRLQMANTVLNEAIKIVNKALEEIYEQGLADGSLPNSRSTPN